MSTKRIVEITVPVRAPTWNQIIAMNRWQQKKLRDSLHRLVSLSQVTDSAHATSTACQPKRSLMELCIAEYYKTIQQSTSRKSGTSKSKSRTGRKKKR